ncbi:MAG: ABC transporter substrate-binding protein [Vulcanimicrobiota bacterium]
MRDFWLIFVTALLLAGCSPDSPRPAASPDTPRRIVSLVPSLTELLFALGAGESVVGVTDNDDFPPEVKARPSVGDMNINYEKVVSLRPDLVLLDPGFNTQQARLESLRVPCRALATADLDRLPEQVLELGEIVGKQARARQLVDKFEREVTEIRERASKQPAPRVFIEIWSTPLMTAGGGSFVDQLITLAGGKNIFSELDGYPNVSHEDLLLRDPDVIVLTTLDPTEAARLPGWSNLRAVQQQRVFRIDSDPLVRPTLRAPSAARQLQEIFTPLPQAQTLD